jgi:hypothetical protein
MFIADNARQSRADSIRDFERLGSEQYVHRLADAALEVFKAANPEPKKAKGGKITGPPPAGAVQVMISGQSITDQVKDHIDAGFLAQVSGQIARSNMNRNMQ